MKKYKFLLYSNFLKILVLFLTKNIAEYNNIVYFLPTNLLHLSINLSILIFDILFITDSILYYLKIHDSILLRISKKRYTILIIKKTILSTIEILISQFIVVFLYFHNINIEVIFTYTIILYLLYIICFTLVPSWINNYKLLIIFVVMLMVKYILKINFMAF